ncbi:transposase-like protein [Scopulibacillus daqui]|uniref:Transposase-like protein n=1 Tax=Scopulibacillus daqui TaxID=1469162 RepID=A0ABS2Q3I2_9BACL|nr:transposase-like protein [Scopulibacillus daqui]
MSKRSYSVDKKLEILRACETGNQTISQIASIYMVNVKTISEWKYVFSEYGIEGLKESTTWKNILRN